MDGANTMQLILEYRYWILIPLSLLEGPIVALVAGTLAGSGYFNIYALFAIFFARDIVMDGLYYALGYFGGATAAARRFMRDIGVQKEHLDEVRELWDKHAGRTMFFGKIAYGLASTFVVLAGTVKMPLKKFFGWGIVVTIVQFGGLLLLGYFFGSAIHGVTTNIVTSIQYLTLAISIIAIIYYVASFKARRTLKKESRRE